MSVEGAIEALCPLDWEGAQLKYAELESCLIGCEVASLARQISDFKTKYTASQFQIHVDKRYIPYVCEVDGKRLGLRAKCDPNRRNSFFFGLGNEGSLEFNPQQAADIKEIAAVASQASAIFVPSLDCQLTKIESFSLQKSLKLCVEVNTFLHRFQQSKDMPSAESDSLNSCANTLEEFYQMVSPHFLGMLNVIDHMKDEKWRCPVCGSSMYSEAAFLQHMRDHFMKSSNLMTLQEAAFCGISDISFDQDEDVIERTPQLLLAACERLQNYGISASIGLETLFTKYDYITSLDTADVLMGLLSKMAFMKYQKHLAALQKSLENLQHTLYKRDSRTFLAVSGIKQAGTTGALGMALLSLLLLISALIERADTFSTRQSGDFHAWWVFVPTLLVAISALLFTVAATVCNCSKIFVALHLSALPSNATIPGLWLWSLHLATSWALGFYEFILHRESSIAQYIPYGTLAFMVVVSICNSGAWFWAKAFGAALFPTKVPKLRDILIVEWMATIGMMVFQIQFFLCSWPSPTVDAVHCLSGESRYFVYVAMFPIISRIFQRILLMIRYTYGEERPKAATWALHCVAKSFLNACLIALMALYQIKEIRGVSKLIFILQAGSTVYYTGYEFWPELGFFRLRKSGDWTGPMIFSPKAYISGALLMVILRLSTLAAFYIGAGGWIVYAGALYELLRMGMWSLFRLEAEQAINSEGLRAFAQPCPLPPIHDFKAKMHARKRPGWKHNLRGCGAEDQGPLLENRYPRLRDTIPVLSWDALPWKECQISWPDSMNVQLEELRLRNVSLYEILLGISPGKFSNTLHSPLLSPSGSPLRINGEFVESSNLKVQDLSKERISEDSTSLIESSHQKDPDFTKGDSIEDPSYVMEVPRAQRVSREGPVTFSSSETFAIAPVDTLLQVPSSGSVAITMLPTLTLDKEHPLAMRIDK